MLTWLMKLSFEAAERIRELYRLGGISQQGLADEFGCDQCRISLILSGKIWGPRELKNKHLVKHGHCRGPKVSKLYDCHRNMVQRCTNPNKERFPIYGGRGIKVCDRWLNSFEDFAKDVGEPPSPKHSLDRIDSDGNYEPGNVRWASHVPAATQQARQEIQ